MVTIENEKLIIEIEHSFPNEFADDLKQAIIEALQSRELNELTDLREFQDTNFTLLELLKSIVPKL